MPGKEEPSSRTRTSPSGGGVRSPLRFVEWVRDAVFGRRARRRSKETPSAPGDAATPHARTTPPPDSSGELDHPQRRDFPFRAWDQNTVLYFSTSSEFCDRVLGFSHGEVVEYVGGTLSATRCIVVGERGGRLWLVDAIEINSAQFDVDPSSPLAYPVAGCSADAVRSKNGIRSVPGARATLEAAAVAVVSEADDIIPTLTPTGMVRAAAAARGVPLLQLTKQQHRFLTYAPDILFECVGLDCDPVHLVPSWLPGKCAVGWVGCEVTDVKRGSHQLNSVTIVASAVLSVPQ